MTLGTALLPSFIDTLLLTRVRPRLCCDCSIILLLHGVSEYLSSQSVLMGTWTLRLDRSSSGEPPGLRLPGFPESRLVFLGVGGVAQEDIFIVLAISWLGVVTDGLGVELRGWEM